MSEKKKKVSRRDVRGKRWASIIAAVLALAMALSAIAAYSGHLLGRSGGDTAEPGQEIDLDAYREYYLGEIERLQKYIDDMGATAPVLGELVQYYDILLRIGEEGESGASEETLQDYRDSLVQYSRDLVEMEPDNPEHRLQLLGYYDKFGGDEPVIAEEIGALRDLLHEKPDPLSTLMLIGFMKSSEQEEMAGEEMALLEEHFRQLEASGKIDSKNRYYYAYLLDEYLSKTQEAKKQLTLILEKESEESSEYLAAKAYLEQIQQAAEK